MRLILVLLVCVCVTLMLSLPSGRADIPASVFGHQDEKNVDVPVEHTPSSTTSHPPWRDTQQSTSTTGSRLTANEEELEIAGVSDHSELEVDLPDCSELVAEVARLQLELEKGLYATYDPYRIFLDSPEAEGATQEERTQVKYALEEIGITALMPGEATWIMERCENNDWKAYGETRDLVLIRFLGPERVLLDADPTTLEKYASWYDATEWLALFGSPKPSSLEN